MSPDQFKTIISEVIQDELTPFKEEVTKKFDRVITAVDNITKKYEDHQSEHFANIGAHDRFETEIDALKSQVKAIAKVI